MCEMHPLPPVITSSISPILPCVRLGSILLTCRSSSSTNPKSASLHVQPRGSPGLVLSRMFAGFTSAHMTV